MTPDELTAQCEALGHTDATRALIVGNRIFDPALFSPEHFMFTRKQYLFLHAYKLGVPLAEAALKAEMSVESADRFLKKDSTVKWLEDRALKAHIRKEWEEPEKWWAYGDEVLEGKRILNKGQMVVYQAFGDRICPKSRDLTEGQGKTTINFNFSQEAVQAAFERQKSIEGELVRESHE